MVQHVGIKCDGCTTISEYGASRASTSISSTILWLRHFTSMHYMFFSSKEGCQGHTSQLNSRLKFKSKVALRFYCFTCKEGPLCEFGKHILHRDHKCLQVRKTSHRPSIIASELQEADPSLDYRHVQEFKVNNATLYFLTTKHQPKPPKGCKYLCAWCKRSMNSSNTNYTHESRPLFCSLECKLQQVDSGCVGANMDDLCLTMVRGKSAYVETVGTKNGNLDIKSLYTCSPRESPPPKSKEQHDGLPCNNDNLKMEFQGLFGPRRTESETKEHSGLPCDPTQMLIDKLSPASHLSTISDDNTILGSPGIDLELHLSVGHTSNKGVSMEDKTKVRVSVEEKEVPAKTATKQRKCLQRLLQLEDVEDSLTRRLDQQFQAVEDANLLTCAVGVQCNSEVVVDPFTRILLDEQHQDGTKDPGLEVVEIRYSLAKRVVPKRKRNFISLVPNKEKTKQELRMQESSILESNVSLNKKKHSPWKSS